MNGQPFTVERWVIPATGERVWLPIEHLGGGMYSPLPSPWFDTEGAARSWLYFRLRADARYHTR